MKTRDEKDLFRKLHPTKEGKRVYRFLTTTIVRQKLYGDLAKHKDSTFYDYKYAPRMWIRKGYIYINSSYAWNGCSPKRYIGWPPVGKWVGTPDFDDTIIPSLIHDALFQFSKIGSYTIDQANWQFYQMLLDRGFALAEQYYDAVDIFGAKFWGKDPQTVRIEYDE
jgi:hypothetical protein